VFAVIYSAAAGVMSDQLDAELNAERPAVEEHYRAGGIDALSSAIAVDVGPLLVDKILGSAVRVETARFIFSDPAASEARYFPGFTPRQTHGDTAVLRDGRDVSLASMAAAAGLERRTFLRRFANTTGMTPIEYCRAVRIARARELLEFGNTPQKEIPQSLGL
jgi:transcriptional regulator GlxA family with amidase domain